MVCLGFEPGAAGWKVQMNPLSYSGTPVVAGVTSIWMKSGVAKWLSR